jgi:pimeloyl-ACP methyl ester carboxylesterase
MKKSLVFLAAGVGTLIAASSFVLYGATKMLTEIAIERAPGKSLETTKKAIAGRKTSDPVLEKALPKFESARRKLIDNINETVYIKSHDGLTLAGHIYEAPKMNRIIICMHGWRSSWDHDYSVIAPFLHDEMGSTLIMPEQRGQGASEGNFIGFGILERYDCYEWIKFAIERYGKDIPIYLSGVSMGATTVLMTTGFDLPESVKGVVADCGFTSPAAIMTHVVKNNLKINDKLTYPLVNKRINKVANFDIDEYSAPEALSKCQVPVLFIHGAADSFVPVHMTFENYEACVAPKDLLIVPGANHGLSYLKDNPAYKNAVRAFFQKYDSSNRDEIKKEIERLASTRYEFLDADDE